MKLYVYIYSLLTTMVLFGQDETIVVEEDASFVLSGDIKLVLDDISLTNSGNLDVTNGEVLVTSTSQNRSFITYKDLSINSLTTNDDNVDFTIEGNLDMTDLTIGSTDLLTVSDTSSLTLSGVVDAVGELKVESGGALWIKGTITETALDNVTVERIGPHNSTVGKYSIFGSPMTSTPFSAFGTNAQSWIFEYEEDTYNFAFPGESTMTPGKGYFVAFPGDADGKVTFSGTPKYKNVTFAVTRTDNGPSDEDEGFNAVANPFTCPLEFDDFISDSGNQSVLEESTIWLWDDFSSDAGGGNSSDYVAVNYLGSSSYNITDSRNGGSSKWDASINVAQGFLIKASTSGNISFKQNMKTLEGNNDESFYRQGEETKYWIGIENRSQVKGAGTLIGFLPEATYEKDPLFDASRFGNGFSVYSLIEDKKFAIQALPSDLLDGLENYQIPIGYNISEEGTYTISLIGFENNNINGLYLHDHEKLITTNLVEEDYEFSTVAGSINDRFTISVQDIALSIERVESNLKVYGNSDAIVVDSQIEGIMKVFTIGGKLKFEEYLTHGKKILSASKGLYIVTVESKEGIGSYKVKVD